jgi:hypothetical protein
MTSPVELEREVSDITGSKRSPGVVLFAKRVILPRVFSDEPVRRETRQRKETGAKGQGEQERGRSEGEQRNVRKRTRLIVVRIDDQKRNLRTRIECSGLLVTNLHCSQSHTQQTSIDSRGHKKEDNNE